MNKKLTIGSSIGYIAVTVYALYTVLPLIWVIFAAFKDNSQIYDNPVGLPTTWIFDNFLRAWNNGIPRLFLNSAIVTVVSVIIAIFISSIAAYSLARLPVPGKKVFYLLVLLMFAVPVHVILVPTYQLLNNTGLLNTLIGLILPYVAFSLSFNIILFYSFFINFPKEVEEAAIIDGASRFQSFYMILMPLSKPVFISCSIFQGIGIWNEFFLALMIIKDDSLKTLPIGLSAFKDHYTTEWGPLMASVVISSIPILLIYLLMQKHFIASFSGMGK